MLQAEAEILAESHRYAEVEDVLAELWRLHKSLPLENYLNMIEDFVDSARQSLAREPDPDVREHMREHYRRVVELAVEVACSQSA